MAVLFLHQWMARDALLGFGLDKEGIRRIIRSLGKVDTLLPHGRGSNHRPTRYQREFEEYGGKACPFPEAEQSAFDFVQRAREFRLNGDRDKTAECLGFAIHFIQDALCPEHIFPFREGWLILGPREPHMSIMIYTTIKYRRCFRNWSSLVRNAPLRLISSPGVLRDEVEKAANWVRSLPCSYRREDGQEIIDPLIGKVPFIGWRMRDEDIGKVFERTASLIKGAVSFVLNIHPGTE